MTLEADFLPNALRPKADYFANPATPFPSVTGRCAMNPRSAGRLHARFLSLGVLMADTLFFVFAAMYAAVAIKVDQWHTISMLGFKSETPQLFLQSPRLYHLTRVALFTIAVVASFFATKIPWYIGLVVMAATWLGAFWLGRKFAFNTFRQIHRDMIAYEESIKNTNPEEYAHLIDGEDSETHRAELEAGARMSDEKLLERIERSVKLGI